MLIEFSIANFRSFKERNTLSLAKASGQEHNDTHSFTATAANKLQLLHSAAIYGPNAGGKSNLLRAAMVMKDIVVNSANTQRGTPLPVDAFRLSSELQSQPSEFEAIFIVNEVRYQYGFTATSERIHEEWLVAYPNKQPQHWFARIWDKTEQQYNWKFSSSLAGRKQLWLESTRENALFLSTAVQLNSEQLYPIYDWFRSTLRVSDVGGWGAGFSASCCEGEEKGEILDFLKKADIEIADIAVKKETFDPQRLPNDLPESDKEELVKRLEGKMVFDIKTYHKTKEGALVAFDFQDESDGTQRIFSFAGPWLDSLANGYVLFIDELHDNLHPKLVKFLVELFHNQKTNKKNAQLVFTTHETSILNQKIFRRDQIWFIEKKGMAGSFLYPLTDFSPKKNKENLELSYLSGRYGALPFIQNFDMTVE